MEAAVLSSTADGVGPAVLLSHSKSAAQYLFNVPEGFSRLVLEHKIRPSAKLAAILLTSVHPFAAGGIGGLLLRLAQDGHGQLRVIGPPGSAATIHALRHIFHWRHPKVFVSDCSEQNTPVLEDEHVVITPLISNTYHRCPCCESRKNARSREDVGDQQLPELDEDSNPVYWRSQQGKFLRLSEALGAGEAAWTKTLLGFTCFIKELETALVILNISDSSLLGGLETMFQCEQHPRGIAAVIHLGPTSAVQSQRYASWMTACQSFHVPVNSDTPQFGFKASLKTIAKLNLVDPKFFPLPRYDESTLETPFCGFLSRVILERRNSGVFVRMDHSSCARRFNAGQFKKETLEQKPWIKERKDADIPEQHWSSNQLAAAALRRSLLQKPADQKVSQFELLFLGTGSAEPSKYRGSSGILLQLGASAMLLDAGEGVLGQLSRRFGDKTAELVASLECLWLSHKHADHVLGAAGVLCSRKQGNPVLVISSTAVGSWLREFAAAMALSGEPMPSFEVLHFDEVTTAAEKVRCVFSRLKLRGMINVPVHHCYEAYGVVLIGEAGWRIVYSGDTRPSERLVQAGAGCTLLIHEATFEDCLEDHARRKRHCTVSEALHVGGRMQAQQVILTHFSQRYPKVIEMDTERFRECCMAFDGMVVSSSSLGGLKDLLPLVARVLAEEDSFDEGVETVEEPKQDAPSTHIRWSELDIELAKPRHIRWSYSDTEDN